MKSITLLATLLLTALAPVWADPTPVSGSAIFNPDPGACCPCISISVNQVKTDEQPGVTAKPMMDEFGNLQVNVAVSVLSATSCANVTISSIVIRPIDNPGAAISVPIPGGLVAVPAHIVRQEGIEWEVFVVCAGTATTDSSGSAQDTGCAERFYLSTGCSSCDAGSNGGNCNTTGGCDSEQNPDLTINISTTDAAGGMSTGSLRFVAPEISPFPGRAALFADVPASFIVTRDSQGRLTSINTGVSTLTIADAGANAFTITHKNLAGTTFRTTTISLVTDAGIQRLRMDSLFDGATTRHEQSRPQPGTYILEKGRLVGTEFESLSKETLIETKPSAGIRVHRRTLLMRPTAAAGWVATSDTETSWEKQIRGWMKTKEIIDPNGAALTSTWTYYQPGDITGTNGPEAQYGSGGTGGAALKSSYQGFARLKQHIRYDGYQAFYTYGLNQKTITTPYAGNPAGKVTTISWDPVNRTRTTLTVVHGTLVSKSSETHTDTSVTRKDYTSANGILTTVDHFSPSGQDFGGRQIRTLHSDGTLTTYSYTRDSGGGYTTVTANGSTTNGTTVAKGTRTTSTNNSRGTTIVQKTEAIGYDGTDNAIFGSVAVTSVDIVGRPLITAYHPESITISGEVAAAANPAWTTLTTYNCCGVASQTDQYGVITYFAYDHLQRQIKSNTLGVTMETLYNGLTTETYRYAQTVNASLTSTFGGSSTTLISRSNRDLSGTFSSTESPDPTAIDAEGNGIPGALIVTSSNLSTYSNQYGANIPISLGSGIGMRTVTTTADNFSQTTDFFVDGRPAKTYGDLAPAKEYAYTVNTTGKVSIQSYIDGTNLRETTSTQSDWYGRTVRMDYMDGAFANMEYNTKGQIVKSTDPDGVVALMAYNAEGEQTINAVDLNGNGVIDYGLDSVRFSETIPTLDTANNPVWKSISKVWQSGDTSPTGGTIVSTSLQSPNGLSRSIQSIGVANPSTSVTTLSGNGNRTTISTSPDGTKQVKHYTAGRLTSSSSLNTENVQLANSTLAYDDLNRPVTTIDARIGTSTSTYLSYTADIVASVTDSGNRVTAFAYDVRGRRISTTLPDNTVTQSTYTARGDLATQSGSQTYPTSYTYDYASRMKTLKTTGAAGDVITAWNYSYTTGLLVSKKYDSNLSGTTGNGPSYTYTAGRRKKTRTWASGKHTRYDRDAGGRLTNIHYFTAANADNGSNTGNDASTPNVLVNYDTLNRPTHVSNKTASTNRSYNALNLTLASETVSYDWNHDQTPDLVRVIDRTRDSLRRPSGFEVKNGITVESSLGYEFSSTDGRLSKILSLASPSLGSSAFSYSYVPNSNLISTITSPVHTVTNAYETNRNVLTSKVNRVDSTTISAYFYNVNHIGQRTSVDVDGTAFAAGQRDRTWGYDVFGQLITESDSNNTAFDRGFAYDSIGNRTSSIEGNTDITASGAISYTPNELNQYDSVGAFTPTQDDNGNSIQTQIRANGLGLTALSQATFVWDGENRLIEVKNSSGNTLAKYNYDAMSRRVRRDVVGGMNIAYLYNGWNPISEYLIQNSSFSHRLSYVWGLDFSASIQGAGGVGGLLAVRNGTGIYCPTYDGNGNVSEYLDSTGAIAAHFEYDTFGNVVNYTETTIGLASTFSHRFSTKQQDDETGLLYYGYRYLDTITGRWPSRDPIEERGGENLYSFVRNWAPSSIDALGMQIYNPPQSGDSVGGGKAKKCVCGPDITKALDDALAKLNTNFLALSIEDQLSACATMYHSDGWDIEQLYQHSTEIGNLCGQRDTDNEKLCANSVTYSGTCFYQGSVNYVAWGAMNRLCLIPRNAMLNTMFAWKFATGGLSNQLKGQPHHTYYPTSAWAKKGYDQSPAIPRSDRPYCKPCSKVWPGPFRIHAGYLASTGKPFGVDPKFGRDFDADLEDVDRAAQEADRELQRIEDETNDILRWLEN